MTVNNDQHITIQDWRECIWENVKTKASTVGNATYSLGQSLFDRIYAIFNFIYPKNAVTGYREFWYLPTWVEMALGESLYLSNCAAQGGKLNDLIMQERVKEMVQKISQYAQRPDYQFEYEVTVLDSNQLNAWAMSGGKLAFYKGIIDKIDHFDLSEWKGLTHDDVLAAVAGHEVAHSAIGHTRKRLEKTLLIQIALCIGKWVADFFIRQKEQEVIEQVKYERGYKIYIERNEDLDKYESYRTVIKVVFDGFAYYASQLYMLMDSRNAEYEADKYGIELMHKAGYDVRGSLALQKLFIEMNGDSHQTHSWLGKVVEWVSTHPTPEKRFAENQKTIAKIQQTYGHTKNITLV